MPSKDASPDVGAINPNSIFIDVDPAVQLDRRLYRDQETRGYSREAILYQWENHVTPCYRHYLNPHREKASFIYRNDHRADSDFDILKAEIARQLSGMKVC